MTRVIGQKVSDTEYINDDDSRIVEHMYKYLRYCNIEILIEYRRHCLLNVFDWCDCPSFVLKYYLIRP